MNYVMINYLLEKEFYDKLVDTKTYNEISNLFNKTNLTGKCRRDPTITVVSFTFSGEGGDNC